MHYSLALSHVCIAHVTTYCSDQVCNVVAVHEEKNLICALIGPRTCMQSITADKSSCELL